MKNLYRLLDLVEDGTEDEVFVLNVIATIENYENVVSKLPVCTCGYCTYSVEEICMKCFGRRRDDPSSTIATWKL